MLECFYLVGPFSHLVLNGTSLLKTLTIHNRRIHGHSRLIVSGFEELSPPELGDGIFGFPTESSPSPELHRDLTPSRLKLLAGSAVEQIERYTLVLLSFVDFWYFV
ncbi:hypothetical protein LINGRAHAP2_LOCUS29932 [Linum grandiflorum]